MTINDTRALEDVLLALERMQEMVDLEKILFAEASPPLTKDTIVLVLRVLWTRSMLEIRSPEIPLYVTVFMAFDIGTPERAGDAEVTFLEERDELFLKSYARHDMWMAGSLKDTAILGRFQNPGQQRPANGALSEK
ncbi:unnamed protein product [Strongylus vulgaris]|uniref:Uncharacterized protein n=1 Tax=Strongylus vulgaris TaxID=40348 RepID=A0A3P7J7M0_STRVU|nr:unnamed protein product [Strongylus vulgaris]